MNAHASFSSTSSVLIYEEVVPRRNAPAGPSDLARIEQADSDTAFKDSLIAAIPDLRAFAMLRVRNSDRADDLVQDVLLKAWGNRHRYESGTSLRAWLFVIVRNTFFSQYRRKKWEIEDPGGELAATLSTPASQHDHMDLEDLKIALAQIPGEQREALILVGGAGFTYEEAAEICGCVTGTVKSRVNRARNTLVKNLGLEALRLQRPDMV